MYKQFDKKTVISLTDHIMDALKNIGKDNGIVFDKGRVGYDDSSFHFDLKCRLVTAPPKSVKDYEYLSKQYNLPEINSIVVGKNGKNLKIVGANLRARRYPILIESENGEKRKTSIDYIQELCDIKSPSINFIANNGI